MTLVTLELQLGAMEPDDRGGTQTGVILWRITDCVYSSAYGWFLLEDDHIILLSVELTCRRIVADVCVDFAWVLGLCGLGWLRGLSQCYVWCTQVLSGSRNLLSPLLLDSMIVFSVHPLVWYLLSFPPSCLISLSLVIFHGDKRLGSPVLGHGCHVGDLS